MIKLINYFCKEEGEVCCISKDVVGEMSRIGDFTWIYTKGQEPGMYKVKETPEEILAMPDIEEGNKNIDWEQRRYEIVKIILPKLTQYGELKVSAQSVVRFVNALIEGLKKGTEQ